MWYSRKVWVFQCDSVLHPGPRKSTRMKRSYLLLNILVGEVVAVRYSSSCCALAPFRTFSVLLLRNTEPAGWICHMLKSEVVLSR